MERREAGFAASELDNDAAAREPVSGLRPSGSLPALMLTGELGDYARAARPTEAERKRLGVDGSRVEQTKLELNDSPSDDGGSLAGCVCGRRFAGGSR